MLDLPMGHQVRRHQVHITLRVEDPLSESLRASKTLSHHPDAVGLNRVSHYRMTGLIRHTRHIYHIGAHPKPVKYIRKDGERLL